MELMLQHSRSPSTCAKSESPSQNPKPQHFTSPKEGRQVNRETCCFHHPYPALVFNPSNMFFFPTFHLLFQHCTASGREFIFDKHLPIIKSQLQPPTGAISHFKQPPVFQAQEFGQLLDDKSLLSKPRVPGRSRAVFPVVPRYLVFNDNTVRLRRSRCATDCQSPIRGKIETLLFPNSLKQHNPRVFIITAREPSIPR